VNIAVLPGDGIGPEISAAALQVVDDAGARRRALRRRRDDQSARDIAGRDLANPTSLILSAAMLLEWLGVRHGLQQFTRAAACAERAVDTLSARPETRTADLGGALGTAEFATALCAEASSSRRRSRRP
jgi:isocitrate/isopropylmalate dehydrogenase